MFGKGKQGGRFPLHSRRTKDGKSWEIVHSRAVKDRREDLDEVRQMLEAGELDIAEDELRWLLEDCHEMIQAHHMLGEIALIEESKRTGDIIVESDYADIVMIDKQTFFRIVSEYPGIAIGVEMIKQTYKKITEERL